MTNQTATCSPAAEPRIYEELLADNNRLQRQLALRGTREIIGNTPGFRQLRQRIIEIAHCSEPALIYGEPGTGKRAISRAVHDGGERAHRPFLALDCAVLTAVSLERELFGEEYTDQTRRGQFYPGRLESAAGGTLVLQNIDEMSLSLQAALAQVLRDHRYRRPGSHECQPPGSHECQPLDSRIIALTRFDFQQLRSPGLFRQDLLAEISRQTVQALPLREHQEDIAALTEHFLRKVAMKNGTFPKRIPTQTMNLLNNYPWPGNVRELETIITHACSVDAGPTLCVETVQPWFTTAAGHLSAESAELSLREMERKLIESTFARFAGNREKTAHALKIGLRTLSGKLREYGYPPRGGPGSNLSHQRAA